MVHLQAILYEISIMHSMDSKVCPSLQLCDRHLGVIKSHLYKLFQKSIIKCEKFKIL